MKSRIWRWAKLISIGAFCVMLLSMGAGPATAVTTCKMGFYPVAPKLCISGLRGPENFYNAMSTCKSLGGRVATYGDLYYIYKNTNLDGSYNPIRKWLGPELSADDEALCGNANITYDMDPDLFNYEGTCWKADWYQYWCAHDLD